MSSRLSSPSPPTGISSLPPELLYRILELAVEGLPATIRIRASLLRSFSLVARDWRNPAQSLLESRVHIDSYHRARAFLNRPRRPVDRPLVLEELVLFFDFAPQDDDFYPLTEFMTRSICQLDCTVKFLHLRSALFINAFDLALLALPAFRGETLDEFGPRLASEADRHRWLQNCATSNSTCRSRPLLPWTPCPFDSGPYPCLR